MTTLGHIAYPTLAYLGINSITGNFASNNELFFLMTGAIIPDLDFLYQLARGKGFDESYKHHNWASHWPITYIPLLILAFITNNQLLSLITYGIYTHLFLDLFFVVDGIKIFYPFIDKFYGFIPIDTNGHHGVEWIREYKKRHIYKLDIIASALLVSLFLWRGF